MTSRLSVSYSVLHCFLSAASVCLPWPSGAGVFFLAATHFVKSGGSGTTAVAPCAWLLTAVSTHLSNSSWVIVSSPTLATAFGGTSFPQADDAPRQRAREDERKQQFRV